MHVASLYSNSAPSRPSIPFPPAKKQGGESCLTVVRSRGSMIVWMACWSVEPHRDSLEPCRLVLSVLSFFSSTSLSRFLGRSRREQADPKAIYSFSMIAAANSFVLALPPRSPVRALPSASVAKAAFSMRSAYSPRLM